MRLYKICYAWQAPWDEFLTHSTWDVEATSEEEAMRKFRDEYEDETISTVVDYGPIE